jgi:hypothetical protein
MRQATQECEDKLEAFYCRRDEATQQNRTKRRDTDVDITSGTSSKTITPKDNGNDPCAICLDNELNNLEHTLSEDEGVSVEIVDDGSLYRCEMSEGEVISNHDTEDTSGRDGIARDRDISNHVDDSQTVSRPDKASEEGTVSRRRADSGLWIAPPQNGEREHECVWKRRFLDESNGQDCEREVVAESSLLGVTVIIHIEGREDLVIRNDLREGEHVTTTTQITSC